MDSTGSVGGRINLGIFAVFLGISLILTLRGGKNDAYAGLLVFMVALFQLFEYGVWQNLDCNPGGSNDKASRGSYILLWAMPAVLCLAAAFVAGNIYSDSASRLLLMGAGLVYAIITVCLVPVLSADKRTWCSTPGNTWMPVWWWLKEQVPLEMNLLWVVGMLLPTLLVDPHFLGAGTFIIALLAYLAGRYVDRLRAGEWFSIAGVLANGIAIWALFYPVIRFLVYGIAPDI
jgi:hypothetical protein